MAHNDKRINKALSAIAMQEKRMLKQGYNRQVVNNFVRQAIMLPVIGGKVEDWNRPCTTI